jgi:hypothetical protein
MSSHASQFSEVAVGRYAAHELLSKTVQRSVASHSCLRAINFRLWINLVEIALKMANESMVMIRERHSDKDSRDRVTGWLPSVKNP